MSESIQNLKDWKGWPVVWATLKSVPVFFLKTKTGRSLLFALLAKAGVVATEDALSVILEVIFYLIVGDGVVNSNEPVTIVRDIFQKELKKIKADA